MPEQREHGISWTQETWNPIRGCSRVSPGCQNCYAERQAARFSSEGQPFHGFVRVRSQCSGLVYEEPKAAGSWTDPHWTGRVDLIPDKLTEPLHWRKPRRVFVNSMSDLFHENLPDEAIDQVFAVMALCPQHTFQVLTKRAKRMREYCNERISKISDTIVTLREQRGDNGRVRPVPSLPPGAHWYPLPWVHLGVSVESQKYADERIPELLATPAAVRWVSAEPLLEGLTFDADWLYPRCPFCGRHTPRITNGAKCGWDDCRGSIPQAPLLDWIVVGGESGPGARPFDLAWARSIIGQCKAAGVPVFMKQLGACITGLNLDGPPYSSPPRREGFLIHWTCRENNTFGLCDRKGGDPSEWPEDLRVREYPA